MASMSSTLMSAKDPSRITPSTKISGEEPIPKLLSPRNKMSTPAPGEPEPMLTLAPATLPTSAPAAETAGAALSLSSPTLVTDTVIFFFEVALATPVTITSSSALVEG